MTPMAQLAQCFIRLAFLASFLGCKNDFLIPKDIGQTIINKGDSIQRFRVMNSNMRHGKKENAIYSWFLDGKIRDSQGDFSGKPLDGTYEMIGPNSELLEKGNFKKGSKWGRWTRWWGNGRIKYLNKYKQGWLHGRSVRFDHNGEVQKRNTFYMGKKEGIEKEYDEGRLFARRKFNSGELKWEKIFH